MDAEPEREGASIGTAVGRVSESHNLRQVGFHEVLNRYQTDRINLDLIEGSRDPTPLDDLLQKFQFADQSSLRETSSHSFL